MIDVIKVASYIYQRYQRQFGTCIEEMKLHKLLYFVQRESLVQLGRPLFAEPFEAWRYGPVLVKIRHLYKTNQLNHQLSHAEFVRYKPVFDFVFENYASKDAWTLSSITHGESSWQKARQGILPEEQSQCKLQIEDIRMDAERIKQRRLVLKALQA